MMLHETPQPSSMSFDQLLASLQAGHDTAPAQLIPNSDLEALVFSLESFAELSHTPLTSHRADGHLSADRDSFSADQPATHLTAHKQHARQRDTQESESCGSSASPPKRRKSTITAAAVRVALERAETVQATCEKAAAPLHSARSPSQPATVPDVHGPVDPAAALEAFTGKPMSKDVLLKLQGKLERNRVLAREARQKKKEYMQTMEERLRQYEQQIGALQRRLLESEQRNMSLLQLVSAAGQHPGLGLGPAAAGAQGLLMPQGPFCAPPMPRFTPLSLGTLSVSASETSSNCSTPREELARHF